MFRISLGLFFAFALAGQAPDNPPSNFVSAKLETSAASAQTLRGSFTLTADGPASLAYRDAYLSTTPAPSDALFGPYLRRSQIRLNPSVSSAVDPANPIRIHYGFVDESFVFPVLRQAALNFELLPAPSETMEPGVRREEIVFSIPPDFELQAEIHLDENHPFAHYRSSAAVESGQLRIVRELEVKAAASPLDGTVAGPFWRLVHDDQQRSFLLRRTAKADIDAWIQSVPAARANALGLRAQQQREFDAARRLFERAVEADPNDRFAWNNLGRALAALGRLDEALRAYRKQIEVNPLDAYAYNNLGLIYERQGNWAQAAESLRKQLQVHRGDRNATLNLPRALIHERRWKEAQDAALNALQTQPGSAAQKVNLWVARVCEGGNEEAVHAIDAALGPRPSLALLNNAAYYLTECGEHYELAEAYIRRALAQVQSSAQAAMHGQISGAVAFQNSLSTHLDTYGWLLYKQGHADRAMEMLTAATAAAPRGEVYGHMAELESRRGGTGKALVFWKQATALDPGMLARVPADLAGQLPSIAPLASDSDWFPLAVPLPEIAGNQPAYFFVVAKPDGSVESVRALAPDDRVSRDVEPALHSLAFSALQIDGNPIPTVHFVRITKGLDGTVVAATSVGSEALAIANDLLPSEFPPPASTAPASTPAPVGPVVTGAGVTAPRVRTKVEPEYSEEASRARLQGRVVMKFVVDLNGLPRDYQIVRRLGLGLDEKAIAAVQRWRFEPGMKDGQAVNTFATIEMNFRLLADQSKSLWHLESADFQFPDGATRPSVQRVASPHIASNQSARASLSFDIDEHGVPVHIQVASLTDQRWADDALEALRRWRFNPAVKAGAPVGASCSMEFVRGDESR
jgi:TonB family protein